MATPYPGIGQTVVVPVSEVPPSDVPPIEPDGPWVVCPRCPTQVGLGRFADGEYEPGLSVAVCPGCGERVLLIAPPDPA